MADQNKGRDSSGDNLDRNEGMGDDEELSRGKSGTSGRSGSSTTPGDTGASTSGTNRGSKSAGGTQNIGGSTEGIDDSDIDDSDIDDVSADR
jgi:hypothetical protein